jgi:hypothetical protein
MEQPRLNESTRAALEAVLEYMMPAEQRDFEEAGRPKEHIFRRLQELASWLEQATVEP